MAAVPTLRGPGMRGGLFQSMRTALTARRAVGRSQVRDVVGVCCRARGNGRSKAAAVLDGRRSLGVRATQTAMPASGNRPWKIRSQRRSRNDSKSI